MKTAGAVPATTVFFELLLGKFPVAAPPTAHFAFRQHEQMGQNWTPALEIEVVVGLAGPPYNIQSGSIRSLTREICTDIGKAWNVIGLIDTGLTFVGTQVPLTPHVPAAESVHSILPDCYQQIFILGLNFEPRNVWGSVYGFGGDYPHTFCLVRMTSGNLTIPPPLP